jgi:predicted lipid carrier protein YhbT
MREMQVHTRDRTIDPTERVAETAGARQRSTLRRVLAAPADAILARIAATLAARHPGLTQRLQHIPPATLLVCPSDLPVGFLIATDAAGLSLRMVLPGETAPAETSLSAPLRALIALAECRIDADAVFFDRTLAIDGDIEPVLALRNAIESESIDIAAVVLAALGPFETPARHAGSLAREALSAGAPLLESARTCLLGPVLDRLDALERAVGRLTAAAGSGQATRRRS